MAHMHTTHPRFPFFTEFSYNKQQQKNTAWVLEDSSLWNFYEKRIRRELSQQDRNSYEMVFKS